MPFVFFMRTPTRETLAVMSPSSQPTASIHCGRDPAARLAVYTNHYQAQYGFEAVMVRARQSVLAQGVQLYFQGLLPAHVVEIGCGSESLLVALKNQGIALSGLRQWHCIDPSDAFITQQKSQLDDAGLSWVDWSPELDITSLTTPTVLFHHGFFETIAERWQATDTPPPLLPADWVICSSLLHELPQPETVLQAIHQTLDPTGLLHVNVPNAQSLHRQMAMAMGLIPTLDTFGERNTVLQQAHVFSPERLNELLKLHGFLPIAQEGYLLKPFTHPQMEVIWPHLPEQAFAGLFALGQQYPDLASEMAIWARRQPASS